MSDSVQPHRWQPTRLHCPEILQARTLEWVAISFSHAWKWKVKVKSLSHVRLLGTPWTAAHQAPLSLGFSRQEHWSGVPLSSLAVEAWSLNHWTTTEISVLPHFEIHCKFVRLMLFGTVTRVPVYFLCGWLTAFRFRSHKMLFCLNGRKKMFVSIAIHWYWC